MKRRITSVCSIAALAAVLFVPRPALAGCAQEWVQNVEACSNLDSWIDRTACGADALTVYAGCVRRTVMG